MADVFYNFDENTLDLYRRYDGIYYGSPLNYVHGYVDTGKAILLNQTVESLVIVTNAFNLTGSNYTIEAFVNVQQEQMIGNIIDFSFDAFVGFDEGFLQMIYRPEQQLRCDSLFPLNEWHHVAFVYEISKSQATLYLDGISCASVTDNIQPPRMDNVTIYIGSGFVGLIDHLSINLKRKSDENIFWDANVAAYYPLDAENGWLLDHGPNGLNATSKNTFFAPGRLHEGLYLNNSDAFYQSTGFTALGIPNHSLTLALWIRAESASGTFLTVSNSHACFLVFGLRSIDQRLIVFLPNATVNNEDVVILGPVIPLNQWIHVAFTWSATNNTRLYTSINPSIGNDNATVLNNRQNLPMTITLGKYHGTIPCQNSDNSSHSQAFIGSLDEVYIYSTELTSENIQQLIRSVDR